METKKIYPAMAKVLSQVGAVTKSKDADMGNAGKYKFRGIDDMYNALHTHFAENGIFIIPEVVNTEMTVQEKVKVWNGQETKTLQYSCLVTMKFHFVCDDGSSIVATGVGHALDTSDKATNKAQSSALKYCLMQTFLIPTEESKDIEDENNTVAPAPKPITLNKAKFDDIISTNNVESAKKALATKEIQGRPLVLTKEQREALEELIAQEQSPSQMAQEKEHREDQFYKTN
jgi:hypothetical protein